MSERRIYLDRGVGETRGVVTLDGEPERLMIRRDDDDERLRLGARLAARVASLEPALATAFLDLGGVQAILPLRPDVRPARGQTVEIEIRAEPRRGKLAVARMTGPADGEPRLLTAAPPLEAELRGLAPRTELIEGAAARELADEAEAAVLETVHPLPGGGDIAIETTRALTSIDVDLGERKGADSKRAARQANLASLSTAARLLRLKSIGGIVVFDLVGRGHDGAALLAAARAAFAPDNPGVAIGPVGRFGTMELSLPRRTRPVAEILGRADGAPSDRTLAQRLLRALEREGRASPGARLQVICAPSVAIAAEALAPGLAARMGARFEIVADPASARESLQVRTT